VVTGVAEALPGAPEPVARTAQNNRASSEIRSTGVIVTGHGFYPVSSLTPSMHEPSTV
jgi:hypothetical protein